MTSKPLPKTFWIVLSLTLCSVLFLIRLSGPSDLESYGQGKNIGFLLDLITQNHWLVQHDLQGNLLAKPPLYTWILAPFAMLFGLNRVALSIPSFLSILSLGLVIFEVGRRRFGQLAGGLAMIAIMLAPTMAKQVALVDSTPLMTLSIAMTAFAAFSAWEDNEGTRNGGLFFWLMASATVLLNGLLGLVLATSGLLSRFWGVSGTPRRPLTNGSHRLGLILFLAITLGWLGAAWLSTGQLLIDRILPGELCGGLLRHYRSDWKVTELLAPTFYLLIRYLPFSLPLIFALWRVLRHPSADPGERRFERFLACWVLFGLALFSLSKFQDPDQLLPLWPAGALLTGRELARFAQRIGETRFAGMGLVLGIILLGATYAAVRSPVPDGLATTSDSSFVREMKLARDSELAARAFKARGLDAGKLNHVDTPITLQLYLATYRLHLDHTQISPLLDSESEYIDLALGNASIEALGIDTRRRRPEQLFRWPEDDTRPAVFQVYRLHRSP